MNLYILTINYGYYEDNETYIHGVFDTLEQAETRRDKFVKQIEKIRAKAPQDILDNKYWEYCIQNRKYMEYCGTDIKTIELNKPLNE